MPAKVFISYRRDDSRYQARMIHAAFCQAIEPDHVFMDIDSIPPGANFRKILKDWVDQCDVLLALIGPSWIDATGSKTGQRRLESPSDFVRIEIAEALARDIPVVPVMIDSAPIPNADLLPDDLKGLVDRQVQIVEFRTFDDDVERLIKNLQLQEKRSRPTHPGNDTRHANEDGRVKVEVGPPGAEEERWFVPGAGKTEWFKDINIGPEMIVVPAGSFWMGSTDGEGSDEERPRHEVTIPEPLLIGKYPVTFDEWDAALEAGGSTHKPDDDGWGRGRRPAIYVSWKDAKDYAAWLSQVTGKTYRLCSEAEWEYCCRAGTATSYSFGDTISKSQAHFSEDDWGSAGKTIEVGSFGSNAFGIYDMHGNVWEWCEDIWHNSYEGALLDGSSWLQDGDENSRVFRGGSRNEIGWKS